MNRYVIRNEEIRSNCKRFIDSLPIDRSPYEVTVKRHVTKRSNRQNSLLWVIHGQVVLFLEMTRGIRVTTEQWHYGSFIPAFCPVPDVKVVRGVMVPAHRTTSELNKVEFIDLIDKYLEWCSELGCVIEMQEDYKNW